MAQASKRLKQHRRVKRHATLLEKEMVAQRRLFERYAVTLYTVLANLNEGAITVPIESFATTVANLHRLGFELTNQEETKEATVRLVTL